MYHFISYCFILYHTIDYHIISHHFLQHFITLSFKVVGIFLTSWKRERKERKNIKVNNRGVRQMKKMKLLFYIQFQPLRVWKGRIIKQKQNETIENKSKHNEAETKQNKQKKQKIGSESFVQTERYKNFIDNLTDTISALTPVNNRKIDIKWITMNTK